MLPLDKHSGPSFFYLIGALASGILLGLSTNQVGGQPLSPLAWICLVPLLFGLKDKTTLRSYVISANLFAFVFLLFAGVAFAMASLVEGSLLILVSALLFSLPIASLGILQKYVGFKKSLLFLPFIWPVFDWYFIEQFIAMPNLSISMNQAFLPWLIQYIDLTGYTGVSFWLVSLNVALFFMLDAWRTNRDEAGALPQLAKRLRFVLVVFFLPPLLYHVYVNLTLRPTLKESIHVSVVQSKYPKDTVPEDSVFVVGFAQLVHLTDSVVQAGSTDLIVWPESAVPANFKELENIQAYLFRKVLEWETPLLTGTVDAEYFRNAASVPDLQKYLDRNYKLYNAAVLITPQLAWRVLEEGLDISLLRMYRKQNLMHFTEHVPLSETFPVLSHLAVNLDGATHLSAGDGPTSLRFAAKDESILEVSPIICWDLLFSSTSSKSSLQRNDFIAALTNESPFGDAFTTSAHVVESFTRLRSIENRRAIAKASTTGYSFFADPFGKTYGKMPWYTTQATTQEIRLSTTTTFYSRHPHLFPLFCLFACGTLFFFRKKVVLKPYIMPSRKAR